MTSCESGCLRSAKFARGAVVLLVEEETGMEFVAISTMVSVSFMEKLLPISAMPLSNNSCLCR